uniref:ATP synthase F0 subunit 6 n=1 Tax=Lefroyothrips lefroyi TaxID=1030666 RepID=UPI00292A448B|nr:ATP synthase F0 subunit 6 [Lefroyothrips lefroyi]WNL54548.1 ATP synthase subunit 6 [Lefroyothrips lefroyi]
MLGLFASFDPSSSIFKELNWISFLIPLAILMYVYWNKPSRLMLFKENLLSSITQQFQIALKTKKDGSETMFLSIFLLMMTSNLSGLLPNIFTGTSHLTANLMISVPLWLGFFLYGWYMYAEKMFVHLVPSGTPLPLISFMVLIELISTVIRPLTLSIRLMANMVSGHLLLTLMGNTMLATPYLICGSLVLVQGILSLLEIGVAFIQAYVFCMLLSLYSDDSDYQ